MNDSKEKFISLITQTMSENLSAEQLDMLIYTLSNVLQSYDISEAKELPSPDMDDTNKLIQNFLSCKKIEGCLPNTLIQYQYTISRFASCVNMDLKKVNTNAIRCYLGLISKGNQNSYVDNVRRNLNTF